MISPTTRSTKEIILRDTYVTGTDEQEIKKAEKYLSFMDIATLELEDMQLNIENLDHLGLARAIQRIKPAFMSMELTALYSTATALENEFLNDIISSPRPSLEDFMVAVDEAIKNSHAQLESMRVSLI
jgi:hypothetical protein